MNRTYLDSSIKTESRFVTVEGRSDLNPVFLEAVVVEKCSPELSGTYENCRCELFASECIFKYLAPLTPGKSAEYIKEGRNLYEVKVPSAPTAYLECGFHSNTEEAKWLLDNIEAVGEAIAHGICDYYHVEWKAEPEYLYRVQVGAFSSKSNAEAVQRELKAAGFDAIIKKE